MYNTVSILQYVFWKVSTIFFPKYKSRNCQKTRSIHSCRKLVNPPWSKFTSLCRLQTPCHGQSPRSISALPQAPVAFQEPRISLCASVLTTKFCPMVLLSSSGISGWIIIPSNSPYGVLCSCHPARLPTTSCSFVLRSGGSSKRWWLERY